MLSEAKPALKPDIREAKGNPNRGGGDARRAIPTAEAVMHEGQSQPRKCYGYAFFKQKWQF